MLINVWLLALLVASHSPTEMEARDVGRVLQCLISRLMLRRMDVLVRLALKRKMDIVKVQEDHSNPTSTITLMPHKDHHSFPPSPSNSSKSNNKSHKTPNKISNNSKDPNHLYQTQAKTRVKPNKTSNKAYRSKVYQDQVPQQNTWQKIVQEQQILTGQDTDVLVGLDLSLRMVCVLLPILNLILRYLDLLSLSIKSLNFTLLLSVELMRWFREMFVSVLKGIRDL